jgi:hypothetical protein
MSAVTVMVNEKAINPSNATKLLGVNYDHKPTTAPHTKAMPTSVRQRGSVIARLANNLRQLATGLVVGKFPNALAEITAPTLPAANAGEEAIPQQSFRSIQVVFNNVARSIKGVRLRDRVSILKLLGL